MAMAGWTLAIFVIIAFILVDPSHQQSQRLYNTTIRIDCGGSQNFVDQFNNTWLSDRYFTGGSPAQVSSPNKFTHVQERTLRSFPISGGKKSCYVLEVPKGRYSIRMFFIYGNYDEKQKPPNFDVSVEGTVVFSWRYPWTDSEANLGVYSDLYAFIDDGNATVCFYSIATDSPVIGALELVEVDPLSYNSTVTGTGVILVNYGRFAAASKPFGAGVSQVSDVGVRAWVPDENLATTTSQSNYLTTPSAIRLANVAPNYYPEKLYQASHVLTSPGPGTIEYLFTVDSSSDYLLCFHFAEIDPGVKGPGQRVFDIVVNNHVAFSSVDVAREVGKFAAYDLTYVIKNLTGSALNISLVSRVGAPMISGLENYALVHVDMSTNSNEVLAMTSLKESLQIPQRMGWNGDPCAPYNWVAWEGVTCNLGPDNKSLVITRLDISSQGLRGSISDKIAMLPHLISLNMSNNELKGSIPSGLGGPDLKIVDLSNNALTGPIPDNLGKYQLNKVVLNNNQLGGQVPLSLYSIGVRGGFINITSNKDLCGVPSLPKCPFFWEKRRLSVGAKVGIAIAIIVVIAGLGWILYIFIRRRRRDDYNFGLPRQILSNNMRYQRQKTNMMRAVDTERLRSSKFGFPSDLNPQ